MRKITMLVIAAFAVTSAAAQFNPQQPIPADKDAMLLFSYIGYRNQEELVGQRTQIDVTMQEDQLMMDEVVVVGYGTLKKRNIVGAVENLAGDAVENRPNADITRSLQGQIPGLNIVQTDGKAAHGGQVTIRGVNNSFKARVNDGQKENKLGQGGSALVLIDGAEGDMSSVNPDDIASISVLKDASSAAVYGARGAFGVILITTKNPEKGKVRVNYNGSVSLHRRTVIWEDNVVTDPVQWVEAFRESYLNSSPTATVPPLFNNYMPYSNAWFEELKRRRADPTMDNYSIDANGNYSYYGETNWLKEIYKSVNYSTTHAVSIQGGREGVSYYVSGRYYNQDGIYKVGEETYKKYNLRAKGSIRIRPWLTLDNNTSLMSSKYHQPMMYYGQQMISRQIDMFAFPFALLKNPDGTWTQTAAKSGYAAFAEGTSWQEDNRLEVANTTTFNFEFVPEVFKVSADVTYKGARWTRDRMENLYTYYTGVNVSGQDNSYSSLENWNYISNYISTNIVGTLTPKLGRDHDLNIVAGWNLEDYDYRAQKTYRQGNLYPSKPSFTLMDGEYYSTTSGGYTWGLVGFFGRINYGYKDKYLAEVTLRYDGSMNFAPGHRWGLFPAFSLGWVMSEEKFFEPIKDVVSFFKLKGSWGMMGNDNIAAYQFMSQYKFLADNKGPYFGAGEDGHINQGFYQARVANPVVTWEKAKTLNLGLSTQFLNGKFGLDFDWFHSNRNDILCYRNASIPYYAGMTLPQENIGEVTNSGIEIIATYRDRAGDFEWGITGNLTYAKNKVNYMDEAASTPAWQKTEGHPIDGQVLYKALGIYQTQEQVDNTPHIDGAKPGDLIYQDTNGDGNITWDDAIRIDETATPKIIYGFTLNGGWKGIDLNMFFQGQAKASQLVQPTMNMATDFYEGRWKEGNTSEENANARWPKAFIKQTYGDTWNGQVSTWWLRNASFLRLKSVELGYTLPKDLTAKVGIQKARIYVNGANLFTIDNYKIADPEAGVTRNDNNEVINSNGVLSYPLQRTITFGANITF